MPVDSKRKPNRESNLLSDVHLLIETPQRSKFRKLMFTLHKWVGAVVALYILLMSLTGVSLVFHDELSDWLCPSPKISIGETRVPFSQLIRSSEQKYPEYKVTGLIVSHEKADPVDVFAAIENGKNVHLEVDPYTGEVLGVKKESEILKFLQDLHFNLLNGKTGRMVNGIGASCLFLLVTTGVVVWWRGIASWLSAFKMPLTGSLKRINWNLHSALGAWVLPMLTVWSLSGFYFGFPDFFEKLINPVFPVSSQKKLPEPDQSANIATEPVQPSGETIDRLIETARGTSRDQSFVERIAFPDKRRRSFRVWLAEPNSNDLTAPRTQVFLDPISSKILAISKSEQPPTGDLIIQWLIKLHFGTFFGTLSKSAWLLVGLTPAILSLSGLFLFVHGIVHRKGRKEDTRLL